MSTTIPFLDLVTPHRELEAELVTVLRNALATAGFVGGPMVEDFETDFAAFCGSRYCVGVGSGTDALRFALIASGVEAGETVVTVPNTFIATTEAISQAGAMPEFVDIDERTYNMDPAKLRAYLENNCDLDRRTGRLVSRRSRRPVSCIIPVHLYGQMCDMDSIVELAERFRLAVIEDACQAHGAQYFSNKTKSWQKAGTIGQATAFSFYPGKNLGACGEAGAVTTNSEVLAQKVRMLREHGQAKKYHHEIEGYNGRLDSIQAGFLRAKLPHLASWNEQRRECANEYNRLFAPAARDVIPPFEPSWSKAVYHLYVIRVRERERLMDHLREHGIGTGIHYPAPLHLQRAYSSLGYRPGDFPIAEKVAAEVVSLPMYPHLEREQQEHIAEAIVHFLTGETRKLAERAS